MTTFLIISIALYVLLATFVAKAARNNGRDPRAWFWAALAVNPLIAQVLLWSRVTENGDYVSGARFSQKETGFQTDP